jgi:hypothetical protein
MEVSRTICLGWPQTASLRISASQIAEITGVYHHAPAAKDIDRYTDIYHLSLYIGRYTPSSGNSYRN